MVKKITKKAYAVVVRDEFIDLNRIEPFTEAGRKELVGQINRPAGESVREILITAAKRTQP